MLFMFNPLWRDSPHLQVLCDWNWLDWLIHQRDFALGGLVGVGESP